jgi:hypothetical protein
MSSLLVDDATTLPNACEVEAVLTVNEWYLDGLLQPTQFDPADDPFECPV